MHTCHMGTTHNEVTSMQPYLLRSALNKKCKIYANVNVSVNASNFE